MMIEKRYIELACLEMRVPFTEVFKRGKPSQQAKQVRARAEELQKEGSLPELPVIPSNKPEGKRNIEIPDVSAFRKASGNMMPLHNIEIDIDVMNCPLSELEKVVPQFLKR